MLIIEKSKQNKNINDKEKEAVKQTFLQFKQQGSRKTPNPAAFAGLTSVYKQAKKNLKNLSKTDAQKYLEGEEAYTLHKPKRNTRFPTLGYYATGLHSDWQADLADFQMLKKENKGYTFLLVCIDVLSKQIYTEPLKTKSPTHVLEGFKKIFKKANATPLRLTTDAGKEFQAKIMLDFYNKYGITKKVVYSEHHAGVAERAIRTIKERLYRYFTRQQTNVWIDAVNQIVDAINHSVNRTIGMAPNSVTVQKADAIFERVFHPKVTKAIKIQNGNKLNVGDLVRLNKWKGIFGKGYTANYTKELFRIAEAKTSYPPHYRIEDLHGERILGVYYPEDFSRVNLEPNERIGEILGEKNTKKGKEFKVRWLGADEKTFEWITLAERYKLV
ncbi:MAG TPA: DDE-type integrase/transposase/recombinase [Planctomycetota bacterium]|nr:DDE-type integrase/transposase/recombinase [Planctomycetota bacterium]